MDCASVCIDNGMCQSAVFDIFTRSCKTNSALLETPNISCSQPVFYAALDMYSVGPVYKYFEIIFFFFLQNVSVYRYVNFFGNS